MEFIVDEVTGDVIDPETGEVIDRVYIHGLDASNKFVEVDKRFFREVALNAVHDHGLHTYVSDPKLGKLNESTRQWRSGSLIKHIKRCWDVATKLVPDRDARERLVSAAVRLLRKLPTVRRASLAAAIFVAARDIGVPLTMKDVADALGVDRNDVWRELRRISSLLGISLRPVRPRELVARIASSLGLGDDVVALALRIAGAYESRSGGKNPSGVAAAAVYIAAKLLGYKVSTKDLAGACGLMEYTIARSVRYLLEKLSIEASL